MTKKIKLGILGGGANSLIGGMHRIAAGMHDQYEVVGGVFSRDPEEGRSHAQTIGIDTARAYANLDALISQESALPEDQRMQAVSVLTPNFAHFEMAKKLLENGFHVICEKPLTTTYKEATTLAEIQKETGKIFVVTYTYTGYPMIRQMREMILSGTLGKIQKVDVQYYQGWINPIIHDTKQRANTWRLDPEISGSSCCVGDIGTHGYGMIEYLTGLKVQEILADLNHLYPDNPLDVDGTILLRFSEYVKGVLRTSQIATGEENNFTVSIYGEKAGLKWEQENPNYLYLLEDGEPIRVLKPGHSYNSSLSLESSKIPPGHPEGIFDAMGNIYKGVAKAIRNQKYDPAEFPSLEEGIRGMNFIEKVVQSDKKGNVWVRLNE